MGRIKLKNNKLQQQPATQCSFEHVTSAYVLLKQAAMCSPAPVKLSVVQGPRAYKSKKMWGMYPSKQ
ncbi:uncharacterized protein MEPE_04622 [Melanopsichium pennsylvanicum]|uniref:Uncharacterized protein n=1 Tax=Melanopsichium pennsylvanicum TaxID=63383 RepID=A0AAJ4XRU0_9BASI|nr:uncharacterized protein MEPE_04622 [Melanopsichium pennsylvanicum]